MARPRLILLMDDFLPKSVPDATDYLNAIDQLSMLQKVEMALSGNFAGSNCAARSCTVDKQTQPQRSSARLPQENGATAARNRSIISSIAGSGREATNCRTSASLSGLRLIWPAPRRR